MVGLGGLGSVSGLNCAGHRGRAARWLGKKVPLFLMEYPPDSIALSAVSHICVVFTSLQEPFVQTHTVPHRAGAGFLA